MSSAISSYSGLRGRLYSGVVSGRPIQALTSVQAQHEIAIAAIEAANRPRPEKGVAYAVAQWRNVPIAA